METDRVIEKLNTALNILDSLRLEIMKEDTKQKKTKKADPVKEVTKPLNEMGELNQQITIKQILEKYDQPADDGHIESIQKIINSNGISLEKLDSCIERVKYANDKEPKNDIKKYTYSCLYKEGKQ